MILAVSSMFVIPMMINTITKFVFYFSDSIVEHGILLLRSQTANEECLVMITPTMNEYIYGILIQR